MSSAIFLFYFSAWALFGISVGWKKSERLGGIGWHIGDMMFIGIFPGIGVFLLIQLWRLLWNA